MNQQRAIHGEKHQALYMGGSVSTLHQLVIVRNEADVDVDELTGRVMLK